MTNSRERVQMEPNKWILDEHEIEYRGAEKLKNQRVEVRERVREKRGETETKNYWIRQEVNNAPKENSGKHGKKYKRKELDVKIWWYKRKKEMCVPET